MGRGRGKREREGLGGKENGEGKGKRREVAREGNVNAIKKEKYHKREDQTETTQHKKK